MKDYYIQKLDTTVTDSSTGRRTLEPIYIVRRSSDNAEVFLSIHKNSAQATLEWYLGQTVA